MIIDTDFADHYKVLWLESLLGDDKEAIKYLIRLWGNCQNRKTDTLEDCPPNALRGICRYDGDPQKLFESMIESRWIDANEDGSVTARGFGEYNANMVKNWVNGAKGGRPKNKPKHSPTVTQAKPKHNPGITQTQSGVTQQEPSKLIEDNRTNRSEVNNTCSNPTD